MCPVFFFRFLLFFFALQTLGTNVLGRYLINADKNIRYVALNTLLKTATIDLETVQRYRKLVLDNLKDADVSIRRQSDYAHAQIAHQLVGMFVGERSSCVLFLSIVQILSTWQRKLCFLLNLQIRNSKVNAPRRCTLRQSATRRAQFGISTQ